MDSLFGKKLSIPLIFAELKKDGEAIIDSADARHLKEVLRFREGDIIFLSDGERKFEAVLLSLNRKGARAKVLKEIHLPLLPGKIALFQAALKGKNMDFVIQKATELGVDYFYPVITRRSIARPEDKKVERWKRVVREACKQSGRAKLMSVQRPLSLEEALEIAKEHYSRLVIFAENRRGEDLSRVIGRGLEVAVFLGPEGGWEKEEVEMVEREGGIPASLGLLTLRAETATIAGLALISYFLGRII